MEHEATAAAAPEARTSILEAISDRLIASRYVVEGARGAAPELPELAPLVRIFDRVLFRSDGYQLEVICIQDRTAAPENRVRMSLDELLQVGRTCLRYTGEVHGTKMPVVIQVWELCPEAAADHEHLKPLRRSPVRGKVGVAAASLRPESATAWTNAFPFGGLARRRHERLLRTVRSGAAPVPRSEIGTGARPLLTWSLVAFLAAVFSLQLLLGEWEGLLEPTVPSLVNLGGLQRAWVVEAGEWFRMASAALLHANLLHLGMNCLALVLGGMLLERLVGRAWMAVVLCTSALGGTTMSLAVNGPEVVSVGASGAVVGMLAAAFAVTFRLPHGPERTGGQMTLLQMLVPSLIPLALHRSGGTIDFAAHLGGAIVGGALGALLLATWRDDDRVPRFRRAAAVLSAAGGLVFAAALGMAIEANRSHARLAPDDAFASFGEEAYERTLERVRELYGRYPRDPRVLYFAALEALDHEDRSEAEARLRAGLADERLLRSSFSDGELEAALRTMLARLLLERGAEAEARTVVGPSCRHALSGVAKSAGISSEWIEAACRP